MKLKDYLYFEKTTITDFAKLVGISRIHMSGIANGFRHPSKTLVRHIQLITNGKVTLKDFEEEGKLL
jgi:transcriptional regulator with XRE-family HTH domain